MTQAHFDEEEESLLLLHHTTLHVCMCLGFKSDDIFRDVRVDGCVVAHNLSSAAKRGRVDPCPG